MTRPEEPGGIDEAHQDALAEQAMAWFVRMSAGEASEADRRAFAEWLEQRPDHAAAYAEAQALWTDLARLPDPRRRTASAHQSNRARPQKPKHLRWALAASLLIAALYGLWANGVHDDLRADYVTGVGEIREARLADGTILELGTDTAVSAEFDDVRRLRLFRGEAFLSVAPDPEKPFVVHARNGVVRVLGTAFSLRALEGRLTVAVAEGRVEVFGHEAKALPLVLGAGEAVSFGEESPTLAQAIDPQSVAPWRDGQLAFADWRLGDVVAELDRYRPGSIVVLDSALSELRFSGTLDLHDTDRALSGLESTLPLRIVSVTPYLTIMAGR